MMSTVTVSGDFYSEHLLPDSLPSLLLLLLKSAEMSSSLSSPKTASRAPHAGRQFRPRAPFDAGALWWLGGVGLSYSRLISSEPRRSSEPLPSSEMDRWRMTRVGPGACVDLFEAIVVDWSSRQRLALSLNDSLGQGPAAGQGVNCCYASLAISSCPFRLISSMLILNERG